LVWFLAAAGVVGALFGFLTARYFERRFSKLYTAAEHWSQGDFSELVEDQSGDELGELATRMDQMALQLQSTLAERQALAVAEERNRLARELHDSAKQQAFAAAFQLGSAISKLKRGAEEEEILLSLEETQAVIDSVRRELTDLIHELRPPEMEGRSLAEAIEGYATEWAQRAEIDVAIDVSRDSPGLGLEKKQALYRVLQEALANIAKHSQASRVEIRLAHSDEAVRLEVSDDGTGFDPNQPRTGLGLNSMRERVEGLQGELMVNSAAGSGTRIEVMVPLQERG
jgi:NarL family two-component system sensor histidine kinase LiaS